MMLVCLRKWHKSFAQISHQAIPTYQIASRSVSLGLDGQTGAELRETDCHGCISILVLDKVRPPVCFT
jgi:hypothetical protein